MIDEENINVTKRKKKKSKESVSGVNTNPKEQKIKKKKSKKKSSKEEDDTNRSELNLLAALENPTLGKYVCVHNYMIKAVIFSCSNSTKKSIMTEFGCSNAFAIGSKCVAVLDNRSA